MGGTPEGRAGQPRWRRIAVRVLVVVGAVAAALGALAGYLNRELFDAPSFAEHIDQIRRDDDVATAIGTEISDEVIRLNPDLVAIRPLIEQVAIRVAGGDVLEIPTRRAANTAFRALVYDEGPLNVFIADVATVLGAVLARVAPEMAPVATEISVNLVSIGGGPAQDAVSALARAIDILAWVLPVVALASFVGAIGLSSRRWATAGSIGRALVVAASVCAVVLVVGGFAVRQLDTDALGPAVVAAAWRTVVRPFWWIVAGLAAVGAVTWMSCDTDAPAAIARRMSTAWEAARSPRPAALTGRIIGALVVGLALVVDPAGSLELLATVAGVGLFLYGVLQIAEAAERARPVTASVDGDVASPAGSRAVRWGALAVAAIVLVAGVALLARPGRDVDALDAQPPPSAGCNGHAELCDRPFDDVAYVASHNAMAVANLPGWYLAEQIDPIPDQLDQGVRALLVDVWSGVPTTTTVVRTSPDSYQEALAVAREELGPEAVAAAQRIANSVAGEPRGQEARFLCHGLCETGSTPFLEMLTDVRAWLSVNPDEVLTLFIEDHVDADLIAADVESAGLLPFVHTPVAGEPWPTLGEMIESGRRLVVMVETGRGGDAAPWLVNGFDLTQETPYTFPTVDDFTCAPNRGPSDAPLFQLNHWLSGFSSLVTNAERVNQRDVLLARAQQCDQERGQLPNFVAVNYVAIGDVYEVVDVLNGVTE